SVKIALVPRGERFDTPVREPGCAIVDREADAPLALLPGTICPWRIEQALREVVRKARFSAFRRYSKPVLHPAASRSTVPLLLPSPAFPTKTRNRAFSWPGRRSTATRFPGGGPRFCSESKEGPPSRCTGSRG